MTNSSVKLSSSIASTATTTMTNTKTMKMATNNNLKKLSTPSTSGNININNNNNISSSNSRKIVEQVTNYINFLEIEQNTSNLSKKRDDTQKNNKKQKVDKSKFSGRKVLQRNKDGTASEATSNTKNFNDSNNISNFNKNDFSQRKVDKGKNRMLSLEQRRKLLFLNHRICTCTSNDDDKTAICEAHAKFNKHFSIDFLLKHPPPHM